MTDLPTAKGGGIEMDSAAYIKPADNVIYRERSRLEYSTSRFPAKVYYPTW